MQSVDDESELVRENTISLEAFFVVVHRRRAVGFSGGRGGGGGVSVASPVLWNTIYPSVRNSPSVPTLKI